MLAQSTPARTSRTTWFVSIAIALVAIALVVSVVDRYASRMSYRAVVEGIATSDRAAVSKKIKVVLPQGASIGASPQVGEPAPAPKSEPLATSQSGTVVPQASGGRKLARTANVGLAVPDVAAAIARVAALAHRVGGEIVHLDDTAPAKPGDRHVAEVTLSIPDARFDEALGIFPTLGTVSSRTIATEDLTDKLVDADARLKNLRREESDLRHIMDRSGKMREVLDVEQQLATVRDAIETLDAERASMSARVVDATLNVSLESVATSTILVPTAADRLADAWRAALANVGAFTLALIATAFVGIAYLPYAIATALLVLAIRRVLVRRFERAARTQA